MSYHHFTKDDRVKMQTYLEQGFSFANIARSLNFSRAAICHELDRSVPDRRLNNRHKRFLYNADQAQYRADKRLEKSQKASTKLTDRRANLIKEKILVDKWSPEQIAHAIHNLGVCEATIYNWINYNRIPGLSNQNLRHKGKTFKRAMSKRVRESLLTRESDKRASIIEHTIDKRPLLINDRKRFGHWEMDGVESRKSSTLILTFIERVTRYAVAIKIKSKHAADVARGLETFLSMFPDRVIQSLTCDRGTEFMSLSTQQVLESNQVTYFYAHPYSPQERGSNENFNGLFREYFPNGTDFKNVDVLDLKEAVGAINQRPMKLHRFKSRYTRFKSHTRQYDGFVVP